MALKRLKSVSACWRTYPGAKTLFRLLIARTKMLMIFFIFFKECCAFKTRSQTCYCMLKSAKNQHLRKIPFFKFFFFVKYEKMNNTMQKYW